VLEIRIFPCWSPAVRTALYTLRSLKLPSVALHLVECTFQRGFESLPLRQLHNLQALRSISLRFVLPRHNRLVFPVLTVVGEQGNRDGKPSSVAQQASKDRRTVVHPQTDRQAHWLRHRESRTRRAFRPCSGHLRAGVVRGWETAAQAALRIDQRGSGRTPQETPDA